MVTFGETQLLRGIPVIDTLRDGAQEVVNTLAAIVDAFLDPVNDPAI